MNGLWGRTFQINHEYGGCANDQGWVVVSHGTDCGDWTPNEGKTDDNGNIAQIPQIRYSTHKNGNGLNIYGKYSESSENAIADTMVVYIDYDLSFPNNYNWQETLTPNDLVSDYTTLTLVQNLENNYHDIDDNGVDQWVCSQDVNSPSVCAYLTITDPCACDYHCVSTITISVYAKSVEGNSDLFSIYSDDSDQYFTILNAMDHQAGGTVNTANGDGPGGVFIAPQCESDGFFQFDNGNVDDDILNIIDVIDPVFTNGIRKEPANGDLSNYEMLTDEAIDTDALPFKYTIVNDRSNDVTSIHFDTESLTNEVGCDINDRFEFGSDIMVSYFGDTLVGTIEIEKFTVEFNVEKDGTIINEYSEDVTLTTDNTNAQLSFSDTTISVTLDNNDEGGNNNNYVDNNDNRWICENYGSGVNDKSICTCLTIDDKCEYKSTITISLYGEKISGNVDMFALFSFEDDSNYPTQDKYVTLVSDWDNNLFINGENGGIFMAPYCGDELFSIDDILAIIDETPNLMHADSAIRYEPANGDLNNYELLTNDNERVGSNTSPLTYILTIDHVNDITSLYFESDTITIPIGCGDIGTMFEYGKPINILFFSDAGVIAIDKFDVGFDCSLPTLC